jgi:hypothetical protein
MERIAGHFLCHLRCKNFGYSGLKGVVSALVLEPCRLQVGDGAFGALLDLTTSVAGQEMAPSNLIVAP